VQKNTFVEPTLKEVAPPADLTPLIGAGG